MFQQYFKILKTGILTEKVAKPNLNAPDDPILAETGLALKTAVSKHFRGSLAIRQVDAGSCNGCELEIHALNNVYYDIERYGIHFVASPRHADVLMVTGPVSRHMETALLRTYNATPSPKWVVAVGDCGVCGGEFGVSYASCGAVKNVIPVDLSIPGCPPTPLALMQGLLIMCNKL